MNVDDVASWARSERAKRRESQQAVADAVGKSRSWLASLERSEFRPRVEDCALLAAHFETELSRVLELAGYSSVEILAVTATVAAVDGKPIIPREPNRRGTILVRSDVLESLVEGAVSRAVREVLAELQSGSGRAVQEPLAQPRPSQPSAPPRGPQSGPGSGRSGRSPRALGLDRRRPSSQVSESHVLGFRPPQGSEPRS